DLAEPRSAILSLGGLLMSPSTSSPPSEPDALGQLGSLLGRSPPDFDAARRLLADLPADSPQRTQAEQMLRIAEALRSLPGVQPASPPEPQPWVKQFLTTQVVPRWRGLGAVLVVVAGLLGWRYWPAGDNPFAPVPAPAPWPQPIPLFCHEGPCRATTL